MAICAGCGCEFDKDEVKAGLVKDYSLFFEKPHEDINYDPTLCRQCNMDDFMEEFGNNIIDAFPDD